MAHHFDISVKRFNEFAQEYDNRFTNISAYVEHIDTFCNLITNPKPHILELACGPGNITRHLQKCLPNATILATDLAPNMIKIAKSNLPEITFKVMDARDIASLNKKFDAIMCSFCLPFLSNEDTVKLIKDCSQKLTENGVLYISTMEGNEQDSGFENTSFSNNAQVYFNYHTQENLKKALINTNFQIVDFKQQDYKEKNGDITTDMIFVARKA